VLGAIGLTIFLLAARPSTWLSGLVIVLVLAAVASFAVWRQRWPAIEYRYASYRVDADGLEIRRGVFFRSVTNVPRSRVQHTDVAQGPLQRQHGLATLIVHTAGSDSAEVHLPGLPHDTALRIRDHLLPRDADDAV